jgi:hypothetical protein
MKPSPFIKKHEWGQLIVDYEGSEIVYKDAKLYPGGSREWDWNETGTHHQPGIQPEDVQEIIDHGADIIVLSQGVYRRLGVCDETIKQLDEEEIEYHIAETKQAIETYNKLREEHKVGGLFHSTC